MRGGIPALLVAGALACGNETGATPAPAPAAPAAAAPATTPAKEPAPLRSIPGHDFDEPGSEAPNLKATAGTMTATIDGNPVELTHFPFGANAVVLAGPGGVSRVTVTGHETTEPFPQLQLYLAGVRLDTLKLPATLPAERGEARTVEIRFARSKQARYLSEPGQATIVVESFADGRLRGTVEGTLASVRGGAPVRIANGQFDVAVRVRAPRPATAP